MPLNLDAIGAQTPAMLHRYDWKDAILYALGIGASPEVELPYLYEGPDQKVFPTYAVIPMFATFDSLFELVGGDMLGVVHGGQRIKLHRPLSPQGELSTVGTVSGIYDLKRMALATFSTTTRDASDELICEAEVTIIFRNDGGFGGEKPPRSSRLAAPERTPDFEVAELIAPEQALLYRLSGDLNPLHADPTIAAKAGFERPILHGLCTYGYVGRAVLKRCCEGMPQRFAELSGDFRTPVFPGDTLITQGWHEGGRVILRAFTENNPDQPCFTNAYAVVSA